MTHRLTSRVLVITVSLALVLVACTNSPTATPTSVMPAPSLTAVAATPTPTATEPPGSPVVEPPTPTAVSADTGSTRNAQQGAVASGTLTFRLVPEASEARYRVREQLLGRSLPNDAVGSTRAVEGQIVFAADGTIVSEQSHFSVDLRTLQSDEARRDNYIKRNTLEVDRYPTAEFRPGAAIGLPWPLPENGSFAFQLEGDLTVHGVTKPVTWEVQVTADGDRLTGTATTTVTFDDFAMTPPRVPIVLSLEETIVLELDFTVERVS